MNDETTEQVKKVPNPTGKGGFGDHPELINPGGRPKNRESFTFWFQEFKNMPVSEFRDWPKNNPESQRSMASEMAYNLVFKGRSKLQEFKEVADRTEGKATQPIEHSGSLTLNEEKEKLKKVVNDVLYGNNTTEDTTDTEVS